jgi:ubiquinone/menaquinone biosynthesis C-methylase UbiE
MSSRILIVNSDYGEFLNQLYGKNPALAASPFEVQQKPIIVNAPQNETSFRSAGSCHKILFFNTYYEGFIRSHYSKNPNLVFDSYAGQMASLQKECFGDSDFYSEGMKLAGWQAQDLIINCGQLQRTWSRENECGCSGLELVVEQIRRVRPQVVYIQDMNMMPSDFLATIRPYTELIVGQIATLIVNDIPFKQYDVIISSFPHYVTKLRASGLTAYYQPLAFDPRILKDIPGLPYFQRPIPCSFTGGVSKLHSQSNQLFEMLARQTSIEFWGYGAESLPKDSPIRSRHHGEVWGKEMFASLCNSKITINRHHEIAENFANNMRLFEATGCGALLITDYKDNLNELFEIGKEVVAYRSAEECVALIKYYQAHPDEAAAIAKAGQERTLRDHTYTIRMQQTAEVFERHLRYKHEMNMFSTIDTENISCGYAKIEESQIQPSMVSAWKDKNIPQRQRALVQKELSGMYQGKVVKPYEVLAGAMRPYVYPGCSVLEIGCASGYYYEILEYLLNKRINYTGVDYSEALIEMAKNYYHKAKFNVADGAHLPFKDREFYIAVSSGILLHVPNYREHIAETVRVAGRFVIAHRTPVCRQRPTQYMKKLAYGVETVELLFNEEQLIAQFKAHGLKLLAYNEYHTAQQKDEYMVTYIFEKRG